MTKKDYILIAKVLKNNKPVETNTQENEALMCLFYSILNNFKIELKKDNHSFDFSKFDKAI